MDNKINKIPLVSICIPVFNGEHLISRALESCINQTYKNIEVVVVDDVSADNTRQVVKSYAQRDNRIKFFQNKTNIGLADNFLNSYKLASGAFIQHLNQDDWLDKNYIEAKMAIFNQYPDIALISSAHIHCELDNSGKPVLVQKIVHPSGFYSADYAFKNFYRKNGLLALSCMVRRVDLINNFLTTISNQWGYDDFYKKGMVIDNLVFLNILKNYKRMYYLNGIFYYHLSHTLNVSKFYGFKSNSIADKVKFAHITRIGFEYFYQNKARDYLLRYRIFTGVDVLADVFFSFLRGKSLKGSARNLVIFFQDYSLLGKITVGINLPFHILKRGLRYIKGIIK